MARKTKRAKLLLTNKQRTQLEQLGKSRKAPLREAQRANILLQYSNQTPISQIQKLIDVSRPTIYKCIDKALAAGVDAGLKDYYHRPFEPIINETAKAWVVHLACTKPKEHGLTAELWSYNALAKYTRQHAPDVGHSCLAKAAKATIWRILSANEIKPYKIKYYLERRNPNFEQKLQEVLMVHQEVNIQNDSQVSDNVHSSIITVSIHEKPGLQAINTVAPNLPPKPGGHKNIGRDYEYKRLGTVSIIAALDLQDGKIIAQVHDRHYSREFIELLKELDGYYPKKTTIRIVLDNHSAHISKETMTFLKSRPGRFVYVHTPKHGSWLNLIETAFSKMVRTFLQHIRGSSKEELKERILKGISKINTSPIGDRWKSCNYPA